MNISGFVLATLIPKRASDARPAVLWMFELMMNGGTV